MIFYNVYNAIEYVKDFFTPLKLTAHPGPTAESDLRVLAAMAQRAQFLNPPRGGDYWYYVSNDERNIRLAQVLLARNGIRTIVRYSHLNDGMVPVLRAPAEIINSNDSVKKFSERILNPFPRTDIDQAIKSIPQLCDQLGIFVAQKKKTL